jgi:hypothetical protein
MSKQAIPPEGGSIAAEDQQTRRAALRALAGVSALAIPTIGGIASGLPDPILTAIERHKAAYEAALALSFAIDDAIHTPEGREVSDAEWDAYYRAREHEEAVFDELLAGAPETCGGMQAIIAHLIGIDDGRLSRTMRQLLALLLKSRVLVS